MSHRKRKSKKSGLGGSPEVHAGRAHVLAREAMMKQALVRAAVEAEDCEKATRHLRALERIAGRAEETQQYTQTQAHARKAETVTRHAVEAGEKAFDEGCRVRERWLDR